MDSIAIDFRSNLGSLKLFELLLASIGIVHMIKQLGFDLFKRFHSHNESIVLEHAVNV